MKIKEIKNVLLSILEDPEIRLEDVERAAVREGITIVGWSLDRAGQVGALRHIASNLAAHAKEEGLNIIAAGVISHRLQELATDLENLKAPESDSLLGMALEIKNLADKILEDS